MARSPPGSGVTTPELHLLGYASIVVLVALAATGVTSSAHAVTQIERAATETLNLTRYTLQRVPLTAAPRTASVVLDLGGDRVTARIERTSMRASGFQVLVQGADGELREVVAPESETYRGTILDRPDQ